MTKEEKLALVKAGREERGKYMARAAVKQKKVCLLQFFKVIMFLVLYKHLHGFELCHSLLMLQHFLDPTKVMHPLGIL